MKNPQKITLLGGAQVYLKDDKPCHCKRCGAFIKWAITTNAKSIPVCKTDSGDWIAHFANCKYANYFRKDAGDGDRLDDILEQRNRERRRI